MGGGARRTLPNYRPQRVAEHVARREHVEPAEPDVLRGVAPHRRVAPPRLGRDEAAAALKEVADRRRDDAPAAHAMQRDQGLQDSQPLALRESRKTKHGTF